MTRIRQPDSGKIPGAQSVWKTPGSTRVRANPAAIWMTRRLTAAELAPTPHSVVGNEATALISVMLSPAVGRQLAFQRHVPPCCPAYPEEDARVASQPGQPGVDHGTALRSGDRGGRRCRRRDGIRRNCADRPVPATAWSLARVRARRSCPLADP